MQKISEQLKICIKQKRIKMCCTSTREGKKINAVAVLISLMSNIDNILKLFSIFFLSRIVSRKKRQTVIKRIVIKTDGNTVTKQC